MLNEKKQNCQHHYRLEFDKGCENAFEGNRFHRCSVKIWISNSFITHVALILPDRNLSVTRPSIFENELDHSRIIGIPYNTIAKTTQLQGHTLRV